MAASPPSVIILCEESQIGTTAFLRHGFDAYSCDLKQTSGPFPERHFCADALEVLTGRHWDLVIAHPPCTFLSHVQTPLIVHHPERLQDVAAARAFFLAIWNYCQTVDIPCCIENPKPSPYAQLPLHSQIVHPYMFGDPYYKRTYLWLYRLPGLFATSYCVPAEHWTEKTVLPQYGQSRFLV